MVAVYGEPLEAVSSKTSETLSTAGTAEVSEDKVVALFCSDATGHLNPMLALAETLSSEGWNVHFYAPGSVQKKIEATGATWRHMGSKDLVLQKAAQAVVKRMGGPEVLKELHMLPFYVVPAMIEILPHLLASVSALKPKFLVYDACAPWGWLVGKVLSVPSVSCMTALPQPEEIRSSMSMKWSPEARKILDDCTSAIKISYGVDYDHNHAYTTYSPYTIVCSSRAWHEDHAQFPTTQFRYWGPLISKRKAEGVGVAAVERLLSDSSIGRHSTAARRLVFCSLGTVTTGDAAQIFGPSAANYYVKVLQAAERMPHVSFIFSVGRLPNMTEEAREDGVTYITQIYGHDVPENVVVARSVNQPELLKRASVFITHCGQNSSTEAVIAGVPVLVAPFFADQIENARRFVELGMGLEESFHENLTTYKNYLSREWNPDLNRVTVDTLITKMGRLLEEPHFKENVEDFVRRQDQELGTRKAQIADLVERMREEADTMVPAFCM